MEENNTKKRVLIVGSGSYIGMSFYNASKDLFDITVVDARKPLSIDLYKGFDSVLHVAGIAHVGKKRSLKSLYYKVNRDLGIESAKLAKAAGVKQFIFMSSMIIYGGDKPVGHPKIISKETVPQPEDYYGDSKLQADLSIQKLSDSDFHVVIIRTPMVYGEGCKGNYPRLVELAKKLYFIPKIKNERTVINIHLLISFFVKYICNNSAGIFYPRDEQPFCTYQMMMKVRTDLGKKTKLTTFFNPLIFLCSFFSRTVRKMFGTKIYSEEMPQD